MSYPVDAMLSCTSRLIMMLAFGLCVVALARLKGMEFLLSG